MVGCGLLPSRLTLDGCLALEPINHGGRTWPAAQNLHGRDRWDRRHAGEAVDEPPGTSH